MSKPLIRNGLLRGAIGLALMLGLGIGCQFIAFDLEKANRVDEHLRPALLTGGAFGPEASAQAIAVAVTAALIMLVMAARGGMLERPARPALA